MTQVGDPDAAAASRPPPEPAGRSEPASPLVLVVDDSEDMRQLLREVLATRGYEVVTAGSSGRALTLMMRRVPDLVITDLMMPGMSGFSLRSLMLRRPELAAVPVIVLSAYWARPGETLDAVAVLTKPINLDRLLEAVERGLEARSAG
jgi:CheY-like chemotaxis protein